MFTEKVESAIATTRGIRKALAVATLDELVEQLKGVLSNAWSKKNRVALLEILDILGNVEGDISPEEISLIKERIGVRLGADLDAAASQNVIDIQKAAYILGANEAAGAGVKIAWNLADQKSLAVLSDDLTFWVGSHYGDNISGAFTATLQEYFDGGYSRADLAKLMKYSFKELGDKSESYWDLLADHTTTKVREIGRVSGYEQAGIEVVRVKARLDKRTTELCRRMHGQVISVTNLRSFADNYLDTCKTRDKNKIKKAWPWPTDKWITSKLKTPAAVQRQIRSGNIGLPPYHARCRTITVSEFTAVPGERVVGADEEDLIAGRAN